MLQNSLFCVDQSVAGFAFQRCQICVFNVFFKRSQFCDGWVLDTYHLWSIISQISCASFISVPRNVKTAYPAALSRKSVNVVMHKEPIAAVA